jgi:hypothetical protein
MRAHSDSFQQDGAAHDAIPMAAQLTDRGGVIRFAADL